MEEEQTSIHTYRQNFPFTIYFRKLDDHLKYNASHLMVLAGIVFEYLSLVEADLAGRSRLGHVAIFVSTKEVHTYVTVHLIHSSFDFRNCIETFSTKKSSAFLVIFLFLFIRKHMFSCRLYVGRRNKKRVFTC